MLQVLSLRICSWQANILIGNTKAEQRLGGEKHSILFSQFSLTAAGEEGERKGNARLQGLTKPFACLQINRGVWCVCVCER